MAEYTIRRYTDYKQRVHLTVGGLDIDTSLYDIECKMRDVEGGSFIPTGVLELTVTNVGGEPSKVDISLTDVQTQTLESTESNSISLFPRLDFFLTLLSSSEVTATVDATSQSDQTVEIRDTQSYD